jgi:hypothetical protein
MIVVAAPVQLTLLLHLDAAQGILVFHHQFSSNEAFLNILHLHEIPYHLRQTIIEQVRLIFWFIQN